MEVYVKINNDLIDVEQKKKKKKKREWKTESIVLIIERTCILEHLQYIDCITFLST